MDWTRVDTMDPHLLVGIVNTTLRNEGVDLEELCRAYEIDQDGLVARLGASGYDYQPGQRQFR